MNLLELNSRIYEHEINNSLSKTELIDDTFEPGNV